MRLNQPGRLTAVVVGLILCVLSGTSHPEELSLVTGNDYLPYSDENLPEGGLATAVVLRVLEQANIDHHAPDFKPWARGLRETKSSVYDATFPYARTTEREQVLLYSEPFLSVNDTFFVHGDFSETELTPADLEDKIVCRPLGYNQAALQELKQVVSFDIETPRSAAQCVSMLARDRVDFFFINELSGQHAIQLARKQYGSEIYSVPMPDRIGKVELHLVMSRKNPRAEAVIKRFNASLKEMKASDRIQQIVDKYLHSHVRGL